MRVSDALLIRVETSAYAACVKACYGRNTKCILFGGNIFI